MYEAELILGQLGHSVPGAVHDVTTTKMCGTPPEEQQVSSMNYGPDN
jgi:hypothetical protein